MTSLVNVFDNNPITRDNLTRLSQAAGSGPVLIYTHDSPDPDALASGAALANLLQFGMGLDTHLVYSGLVARAENRAMLHSLTPEWEHIETLPSHRNYSSIALVDSQPGAGNNRLPDDIIPSIVIDHHQPLRNELKRVQYIDVRPEIGSNSTMLFQYLHAADLLPDSRLATALFYGLQTDTRGLARGATSEDEAVYLWLLGNLDREKLIAVEQAGLPREYYRALSHGLHAARLHEWAVVADLSELHRPDFAAEMADVLIRLDNARAVLCFGIHQKTLYISLRTRPSGPDAGGLVQKIVANLGKAGGHGALAGGQIVLHGGNPENIAAMITGRFLELVDAPREGVGLLDDPAGEVL